MTWFRRHFGLDPVDVIIQATLTGLVMGFFGTVAHGPAADAMPLLVAGASVVVFGIRRAAALRGAAAEPAGLTTGQMAAARLEELEERVDRLEAAESRVLELEERLDFTERLLAQATGERSIPAAGSPAGSGLAVGAQRKERHDG